MAVDPSLVPIAASLGKGRLNVYRAPSIALITTGDEVVRPDQTPLDHQIRDSNSSSIEALLKNFDITLRTKRLVPDSRPIIREAIERGLESDLLIITGGVSMGVADYVPQILSELGVRKVFHKVRVKPGFPLWFGRSANGGAVFGLPGNPVSSQVACRIFVSAYIRRFMGFPDEVPLRLPLAKSKSKKHDREEYAQARLILKEGRTMIEPIRHNGSGDFIHLLGSSGVMVHPAGSPELREGEAVEFHFWRPC
jgi:molybdopterin molybdotransferase